MNYETLEAFYEGRDDRRWSIEVDLGVWWRESTDWPTYRLSWVEKTGELYTFRQALFDAGPAVQVIAVIPDRGELERWFEGWAEQCGPRDGLAWVRARIASWCAVG